jgi:hypothetical protein
VKNQNDSFGPNSEGATSTHLPVAPSKRHRSFAPSRIDNANCGASCVVRSLRGEVTTLRASCVTEHRVRLSPPSLTRPHEAVSNLRHLFDVELADYCCNENAMQQDFQRQVEIVGPFAQECPISRLARLKVTRSQFYDGVRSFAVSARDSMVLHGRFLILNGIGVGCVRVGEC